MSENEMRKQRERLAAVLDAFGADRSRWPRGAVQGMDALLQRDARARELLAEARRLDEALDRAATLPGEAATVRLADRIVAAAVAERARAAVSAAGDGAEPGRVVAWPGPARRVDPPAAATVRSPRTSWRAAAMLAASLALGVVFGVNGILPTSPLVSAIEDGLSRDRTASLAQSQLDVLTTLDEELL